MTDDAGLTSPRPHSVPWIDRVVPPRLAWLAVFLIALLPRLALLPWFRGLVLTMDEAYYWKQSSIPFLTPQFRPPLWPFVLKWARLFSDEAVAGRLLAIVLGALFVVLVFALAQRLFGRRTAWAAALIAAFEPELIVWSHFLFAETLFSSLMVLACLALFPREPGSRTAPWVGSLILGLALLSKEFAVVLFAALAATQILLPGSKRIQTLALSLGLFLVPITLYWGALSLHTGKLESPFQAAVANAERAAEDQSTKVSTPTGEKRSAGKTVASVAAATGLNLKRLWGSMSFTLWRLGSGHYGAPVATWVCILFVLLRGLVLGAGLVGLICETEARWRTLALTCIGFLSLTALPVFLVSRFRVPFMFLFIIGAARAITAPRFIRERLSSRTRAVTCAVAVVLLAGLLLWTFPDVRRWG